MVGMKTKFMLLAAGMVAALSTAQADLLEFDDVVLFGGTLSYSGDPGAPLIGTNIIFDTVVGTGTPANNGVAYEVVGGDLDFTTGPNTSEGAFYTFGSGGSFVLSGTVRRPDLSIVASGVLLSGSFVGESIVLGLGGGNGLFSGVGTDTKNPDLLAEYGITAALFDFANTEIGFAVAGLEADGGFVADVRDADLTNTARVPEGGIGIGLLGFLLTGMGLLRARLSRVRA
jgi:hypothetical protein